MFVHSYNSIRTLQEEYVEDLIKRLGLAKSADTIVGDVKTRGISGRVHLRRTFAP